MSSERLDLLVLRYQQTAADLSYLRTAEPTSILVPRLNDLVARGHTVVYQRRSRASLRAAAGFLWNGYPRMVWEIRRYVFAAAAIQIALALFGFLWGIRDPVDAASFLPAQLRDIAYFHHRPVPAALMAPTATGIFVHNIYVALFDIGGGLTLGLTTLYGLYLNSMLLGVLSALANQPAASGTYWSLIVPHAVIELTAFTICAGAGLSLAAAVIRGGATSRGNAVRSAGRRAAMIGLGTMPLLVVAGTIEGFVTPSSLPIPVKIAVAPATAIVLAAYLLRGRPGETSSR